VKVGQHQVATNSKAANLTFESACRLLQAEHSPIAMYYNSTTRLILIYRPSEGGSLSRTEQFTAV